MNHETHKKSPHTASLSEDDLERLVLARSPRFQALLEKSRQSIREGRGLSHDEFWKAVDERYRKKKASAKRKAVAK